MPDAAEPLLSVRNLKKYFPIRRGILSRVVDHVKAVDDISFDINKGETITMAPLVVKDKVMVGNSGGELGVRGCLTALDVNTGKIL